MDMLVKLYELKRDPALDARMAEQGVVIRRVLVPELPALTAWIEPRFGAGWAAEATVAEPGAGTLRALSTVGVGALYLGAVSTPFELKSTDQQNLGTVRSSSVYLSEAGGVGTVQQIDLTV